MPTGDLSQQSLISTAADVPQAPVTQLGPGGRHEGTRPESYSLEETLRASPSTPAVIFGSLPRYMTAGQIPSLFASRLPPHEVVRASIISFPRARARPPDEGIVGVALCNSAEQAECTVPWRA